MEYGGVFPGMDGAVRPNPVQASRPISADYLAAGGLGRAGEALDRVRRLWKHGKILAGRAGPAAPGS
ncbi:hypothetical protein D3C73_1162460 [compost metagenome]